VARTAIQRIRTTLSIRCTPIIRHIRKDVPNVISGLSGERFYLAVTVFAAWTNAMPEINNQPAGG
jgi:hypothetical protein